MDPSTLSTLPERLFTLKDEVAPLPPATATAATGGIVIRVSACSTSAAAPDDVAEDLHPTLLILGCVGIEVDHLAVVEADPESFLNEHVALFFFGKR